MGGSLIYDTNVCVLHFTFNIAHGHCVDLLLLKIRTQRRNMMAGNSQRFLIALHSPLSLHIKAIYYFSPSSHEPKMFVF